MVSIQWYEWNGYSEEYFNWFPLTLLVSSHHHCCNAQSLVCIVGASAWNDHLSSGSAAADTAATAATTTDTSFRIVTAQGTHIYCTAPTSADRNVWLASLHAGLEASLSGHPQQTSLPPFMPPSPRVRGSRRRFCTSCGKLAFHQVPLEGAPLPQYGKERPCPVCPLCSLAQGLVLDVQRLCNLYHQQMYEQGALVQAKQLCWSVVNNNNNNDDDGDVTEKLLDLIASPSFGTYRRVCPTMEEQCVLLESLQQPPSEFLESLEIESKEQEELGEFKKQAFRVAGDMGSAIKLLQEHSACTATTTTIDDDNNADMLSYILEFFLDLCQEGELTSVAFFWPQLQCIHLRMLPPENAQQLKKVELMEDFLLTVSTKYSVHLALELVWGYSADLEESLYNANCSPAGRRRRFSVLRFVCELESLLFDFEHGWGGGSVALKNMLTPSPHQVTLLRLAMLQLQDCRQQHKASLSRSVRRDKLVHSKFNLPPEEAAQEALRIARNADYFSSHLSFVRRLGDIAEKLRHLDLELRAPTLERELTLLNSSGGMGGDPLNRVHENLIRVVRVPRKEGHVFRSKERTPVLLLMEVVEEGVEEEEEEADDDVSTTPYLSPEKSGKMMNEKALGIEAENKPDVDEDDDSGSTSEQAKGEDTGEAQSDMNDGNDSESSNVSTEMYSTPQDSKVSESEGLEGNSGRKRQANGIDGTKAESLHKADGDAGDAGTNKESETSNQVETEDKESETKKNGTTDDIYSDPLKSLDEELSEPHYHSPRGKFMYAFCSTFMSILIPYANVLVLISSWEVKAFRHP